MGWNEQEAEAMGLLTDMMSMGHDYVAPPASRQGTAERPLTGVQLPSLKQLARVHSPQVDGFSREPTPVLPEVAVTKTVTDGSNPIDEQSENADTEVKMQEARSVNHLMQALQPKRVKNLDDMLKGVGSDREEENQKTEKDSRDSKEQERWKKVFSTVKEDNACHREDMPQALELIGMGRPDKSWIDEAWAKVSKFVTCGEEEFMKIVKGYKERQRQAYWEAFQECDADGSGTVEADELKELLKNVGIVPMEHVLEEVIIEVDHDRTGNLEFGEFEEVMNILRTREGFTKQEYGEFVDLFHKFDRSHCGEIDSRELLGIIQYLGFTVDGDNIEMIVKSVDFDGSGKLNEAEFLACIRQIREMEIHSIMNVMKRSSNGAGVVKPGDMRNLLNQLGYTPDMDAVWESARDAGIDAAESLDLSKLWQVLVVFRAREGFSAAEAADVEQAFKRYDKHNEGEISTLEVGKVLRWLGYTPAFEVQQQLVTRVDIDGSGMIDVQELRKMLRMLQSKEMDALVNAFKIRDVARKSWITLESCNLAMVAAGCVDGKGLTPTFAAEERVKEGNEYLVSFDSFMRTAIRFRKQARRAFRENCGFSDSEISEIRECFRSYDRDGSGDISSKELIRLIEDLFPSMAHSKEMRPKLAQLMQEVDADGSGSLDFQDFMRLMQQLQELQNQEKIAKEQRAVSETGFSQQEVQDFRELFLANDAGAGCISFQQLTKMLAPFCPLGDKNTSELAQLVQTTTGKQKGAEGYDTLDFPDFISLMKRLMEIDFAGIRNRLGIDAH